MEHTKNYLTIHLYRVDEVLASIRWAILSRNHTQAIFWGLELYDSNMEAEAIQMLHMLWISRLGFGSGSWNCFIQLQELFKHKHIDRDRWCQLLMSWCRIPNHDTTGFYLLIRGASTPCDWQPRVVHTKEYGSIDEALDDMLRRGKLLDSWLLSRAIDPDIQWSILLKLAIEKGRKQTIQQLRKSKLTPIEQRAAAFVLVSLDTVKWSATLVTLSNTIPTELLESIDSWDAEDSLRKRRIFNVRSEAILYLCQRSSQPVEESNESEIQNNLDETLKSSNYWQGVLKPYMKGGDWKSNALKEKFYDVFFNYKIYDIPDEWSLSDREKSHGRGLGKTDSVALKQFLHHTFQRSETLGLWDYNLDTITLNSLNFTQIYSDLYLPCSKSLDIPLKATTKVFEIQV